MTPVFLICFIGVAFGQTTSPLSIDQQVQSLIHPTFLNVDVNHDGVIQFDEFDKFLGIADTDNDGCVSKKEYEDFSATPPHIADRIYDHFDPTGTNCWTVQTIASQFTIMDEDSNGTATETEFGKYFLQLLNSIIGSTGATTVTTPPQSQTTVTTPPLSQTTVTTRPPSTATVSS